MRKVLRHVLSIALALAIASCAGSPTDPVIASSGEIHPLETGRWTGSSACLSVESAECHLFAGCWHGRFATPSVSPGGTFSVDGSFRFEAGPEKDENPPAARFTGSIRGNTLTLTVQPASGQPITYEVTFEGPGTCPRLCV